MTGVEVGDRVWFYSLGQRRTGTVKAVYREKGVWSASVETDSHQVWSYVPIDRLNFLPKAV